MKMVYVIKIASLACVCLFLQMLKFFTIFSFSYASYATYLIVFYLSFQLKNNNLSQRLKNLCLENNDKTDRKFRKNYEKERKRKNMK